MKSILAVGAITFVVMSLVLWIGVQADLYLNPFVRDIGNLLWWQYITSGHGLTLAYLNDRTMFYVLFVAFSTIVALLTVGRNALKILKSTLRQQTQR